MSWRKLCRFSGLWEGEWESWGEKAGPAKAALRKLSVGSAGFPQRSFAPRTAGAVVRTLFGITPEPLQSPTPLHTALIEALGKRAGSTSLQDSTWDALTHRCG